MKILFAFAGFCLLTSCIGSSRECTSPATDREIRDLLVINQIAEIFKQKDIVGLSPEEYMRQNPTSYKVEDAPVSWLSWLLWEPSALPKYQVQVSVAYRRGPSTLLYTIDGLGNSCGRLPDGSGEGRLLEGPHEPPACSFGDEPIKLGEPPRICEPDYTSRDPAVPVEYQKAWERWGAKVQEDAHRRYGA